MYLIPKRRATVIQNQVMMYRTGAPVDGGETARGDAEKQAMARLAMTNVGRDAITVLDV